MNYTQSPLPRKHVSFVALLGMAMTALASQVGASQDMHQNQHSGHQMPMETASAMDAEDHSQHMQVLKSMNNQDYQRSTDNYVMPAVELVDMHGNKVNLEEMLNTDQPLMVNFIYTSCTTICPILSATFSQAQRQMGEEAKPVKWLSFSIDPEYDTPARLREYAKRFHAGDNWHFFTGDLEQVVALQKAFDVYFGSKANHKPVTLMRAGRDQSWVRLEGLTSGAELVSEYRHIAPQQ